MPDSPSIADKDIPELVRRCWQEYQEATKELRLDEQRSLSLWLGGDHQWLEAEVQRRRGKNRPVISINRCRPVVSQVTNEALGNPPGPEAHPVGQGADKDSADILEGMIREYEFRSNAQAAYVNALDWAAKAMRGVFEMTTEYAGERTMEQQIVINYVPDPALYFHDPKAVQPGLADSMWGGSLHVYSREQMIEEFGNKLKVLDRNALQQVSYAAAGWIKDAFGWTPSDNWSTTSEWTGGNGKGPFYVCQFYRVSMEDRVKLQLWSDNVLRFDDEKEGTEGKTVKLDSGGKPIERWEPRRKVTKYVVTALDTLKKTEWYGTRVPHFWVLGPEAWKNKKRIRASLIYPDADGPQRGLNFTATTMTETIGLGSKAPWVVWEGQTDVTNAQGANPWENNSSDIWAFLPIKPTWTTHPTTGQAEFLPAPQRNTWEAPIARLMEAATWFVEQIKGATSVFFEPSLPSAQKAQSGEAIKALQAQTNIGTINWQKQLQAVVEQSYEEARILFTKLYSGQRVRDIVRPDTQHELIQINREFPANEIDMATGKHKKPDGTLESRRDITADHAVRVKAGPNFAERNEKAVENVTEVVRVIPQLISSPIAAAQFLRLVGKGNPEVEAIADTISPPQGGDMSPDQMKQALQQSQVSAQQQQALIQKLSGIIQAKLPEIEAGKWKAAVAAMAGIREAEIKAGSDQAGRELDMLDSILGMAHEQASDAAGRVHDQQQQMADQQHQTQLAQTPPPIDPNAPQPKPNGGTQ